MIIGAFISPTGIELEQFQVTLVPPLDTWIDVEHGLQIMR
jgi:hypothetical protein